MTATWTVRPTLVVKSGTDEQLTSPSPDVVLEQVAASDEYPDMVAGIPMTWIEKYARLAAAYATVTEVDPGVWYAEVPRLRGAGIDGDSAREALEELHHSIVGWVAVRLRAGADIPVVDGLDLNPRNE